MGEEDRSIIVQDAHTKADFIREVEEEAWSDFVSGRKNNITDIILSIVTVVASLIATILASTPSVYPWVIATAAAIPAASTSLQRIVGFRERSDWYFQHAERLRELVFEVKHAKAPDLEEYAGRRGKIEVEMGKKWRQRNSLAAKPSSGS
jgi:hypothetical protein